MLHEYLMFWLRETLSNIVRNRLMSLLAVSTVTVGLFILGGFYLTVANLQELVADQTDKLQLDVYLHHDLTPARRKEIYDGAHIPQVKKLTIETKDQVLAGMKRDMPNLPLNDFEGDNNPLGDELHILVKRPEDLLKVRDYMASVPGVDEASANGYIVQRVLEFNRVISVAGVAALIALGLAILLIIHNAIRLTIFARRREIGIMEMVGATSTFVSLPFLLEGVIYGIAGAIIALLLLKALCLSLGRIDIPTLQLVIPIVHSAIVWEAGPWMLFAGLAFGLLGSWISLSRSLDQAAHI